MKPHPVERIGVALISGLYDEQARRRGQVYSRVAGVAGVAFLGEISPLAELATHKGNAASWEMVPGKCTRCGVEIEVPRLSEFSCGCDKCRDEVQMEDVAAYCEKRWAVLCPHKSIFRTTDPKHAGFPAVQFEATRHWAGEESLMFYGETGTGKTRLAMHLLKRCLFLKHKSVGILWPYELKNMTRSFDRARELERLSGSDVLLMDDALLTGAHEEKTADFLKDVLDVRAQQGGVNIITTQVGGDDYKASLTAYAKRRGSEVSAGEMARVEAILRRLRESSRTVAFGAPVIPDPNVKEDLDF
tara:strand:- start:664 stop:1569 length:906 start_codon:yes stop_codon:yes gene_type:complete